MKLLKIFRITAVLFTALAVTAVSGCTFADNGKDGTVTFRLGKETLKSLSAARSLTPEEMSSLYLSVSLKGEYEDSVAVQGLADAQVTFSMVPVGVKVYASATIYANEAALEKLYSGKSETFEVAAGTNETKITLRKYMKVTFENGGTSDTVYVFKGDSVSRPEDPEPADGGENTFYVFEGWQLTSQAGSAEDAYDFESPVTSDITLKARWTEKTYVAAGISVSVDPDSDIEVERSTEENAGSLEYVFRADSSYETYLWKIDGKEYDAAGGLWSDSSELRFSVNSFTTGKYDVSLLASKTENGETVYHSYYAQVQVE